MSHHESFAFQQLRNVINKQGIFVQQANVDVARLKLEILSLKNHVKRLEEQIKTSGGSVGAENDASDSASQSSGVNIPNKNLSTDQTLQALSNLTSSMSNGGNGDKVPM